MLGIVKAVNWFIFLFAALALEVLFPALAQGQSLSPSETLSSDELAVYAAILDSSPKLGKSSRALIADTTSTFGCDDSACNGLSIAGCNGLRDQGESPSDRMTVVQRDLQELQTATIMSFEEANQKCVSINTSIPASAKYHLFNDPDIPKDWKYSFLVYFSRVGFNSEHTQALINVGLFSATNGNESEGQYLLLTKKDGKWTFDGSSAVWKLTSP